MTKSTIFKFLLTIIGTIALIVLIVNKVDIKTAINLMWSIPKVYFLLFFLLSLSVLILKSLSYYYVLKRTHNNIDYFQGIKIFVASQLMSFLPAGEAGRIFITRKEIGISKPDSASSVFSHTLLEIISTVLVALIGSIYFKIFRIPALISLGILTIIIMLFVSDTIWNWFIKVSSKIGNLKEKRNKWIEFHENIKNQIFHDDTRFPNRNFTRVLLLLLLSQVVGGILIYFIAKSLNIDIQPLKCLFLFGSASLLQGLLAILPGGIGITEGGLTGLLLSFGVTFNKAIAVVILFRVFTLVQNLILGSMFFMFFYHEMLKNFIFRDRKTIKKKKEKRLQPISFLRLVSYLVYIFLGTLFIEKYILNIAIIKNLDAFLYNLIANGSHFKLLNILVWSIDNNFLPFGFQHMPNYFIVMIGLFLISLLIFNRQNLKWALMSFVISSVLIPLFIKFTDYYAFRQRPYYIYQNNLSNSYKEALKGWNSFPSGHTRDTVLYSVIMTNFVPTLTLPLILLALFVGFSRIYTGAHYPTDVIWGWIVGYLMGQSILLVIHGIQYRFKEGIKSHEKAE